jgi:hypothetical protein
MEPPSASIGIGGCVSPQPNFDSDISEMARFGGLFHLFRRIPNAFKKKRYFDNELHKFRPVKNSAGQNWHKIL